MRICALVAAFSVPVVAAAWIPNCCAFDKALAPLTANDSSRFGMRAWSSIARFGMAAPCLNPASCYNLTSWFPLSAFLTIDITAHNLAHSSVNSSSCSSCSFSHSCALVIKYANSSNGLVFGTDACAPATVLNIGPSMCVLSMIRYYVCPFDKRQERFCPYQLFQSHVHNLPVFKMNQFGIEDIFPHSIIHLEALVGDSYELLMWQFKYAYWSARWKLHVECWYWQLVLNNHDCYIAQCFRAIRPPVRFASFVISLVSKIPSIQLPTLSRSLARKLKSGWRLPRHSCVAASFALAEALECKYLRDELLLLWRQRARIAPRYVSHS